MSGALALALALLGATPAPEATPAIRLELLDLASLPGGRRFDDVCVGGWSAIVPAGGDRYVVLSDSRRSPRSFTVRIPIVAGADGRPRIGELAVEATAPLLNREGLPFPDERVDPEGLAPDGAGGAFLSSEGVARKGIPPFVDHVELPSGRWRGALPIPPAFLPGAGTDGRRVGVQDNLGFEAMTTTPDHGHLLVATEAPLAQDLDAPQAGDALWSRLLVYRLGDTPVLERQLLYPLLQPPGEVVAHGVVELLALDDRRILSLERTFARDRGLASAFFELDLEATTPLPADARGPEVAARSFPVVAKRPVLDLGAAHIPLENYEGMTFGPRLPDGDESLLVVGDDDNVDCPEPPPFPDRPTIVLLFRLRR